MSPAHDALAATAVGPTPQTAQAIAAAMAQAAREHARLGRFLQDPGWRWQTPDGRDAWEGQSSPPGVVYRADLDDYHRLLSGAAFELGELLRGRLVPMGPVDEVLASLRLLPRVGERYCALLGIADFEHRPINVLRLLSRSRTTWAHSFPRVLEGTASDGMHLVARILGGLPTTCRGVQAAMLADLIRVEPTLAASHLPGLFHELADGIAGASFRADLTPPTQV